MAYLFVRNGVCSYFSYSRGTYFVPFPLPNAGESTERLKPSMYFAVVIGKYLYHKDSIRVKLIKSIYMKNGL